jgi:hypothetical protein
MNKKLLSSAALPRLFCRRAPIKNRGAVFGSADQLGPVVAPIGPQLWPRDFATGVPFAHSETVALDTSSASASALARPRLASSHFWRSIRTSIV